MKDDIFNQLVASVREGGAVLRGEQPPARVRTLNRESVAVVSTRLGLSQPDFARMIGVSVGTLRNWEQVYCHRFPWTRDSKPENQ